MSQFLSPHFTLDELTISETAERLGLDNTPGPDALAALRCTAAYLEDVRLRLAAAPILVSSGYRSPAVNAAVGSKLDSQHVLGQAVDFIAPRYGSPAQIVTTLAGSDIPFDQLILEFGRWVHISFKAAGAPRRMAFAIDRNGPRPLTA